MIHDEHPDACTGFAPHANRGDDFGYDGCTTEEVREEELRAVIVATESPDHMIERLTSLVHDRDQA